MIISISGKPGSGKSTIAKLLSEKLKMKKYNMGQIRRDMAKEKGITLNELDKLGEESDFSDRPVEDYVEKLGKTEDNIVIESRTAFHFIPSSIKIFIDVSLEEGAKRIMSDEKSNLTRNEHLYKNIEEAKKKIKERMESDEKRYKKYYGIEPYDPKNFDFVVDSTNISKDQVLSRVLGYIKSKHI